MIEPLYLRAYTGLVPYKESLDFDGHKLDLLTEECQGHWGVMLAHGRRTTITSGILEVVQQKLKRMKISCVLFNFPFRQQETNKIDPIDKLEQCFATVYYHLADKYPNVRWCVGGHDLGAEVAVRVTPILETVDGSIPPIISLNLPIYPPHKPEMVDASMLGAVMGDALFCQSDKSNQGSYDRLANQLKVMAGHAHAKLIKGVDHNFLSPAIDSDKIGYWIAKDIENFLKDVN